MFDTRVAFVDRELAGIYGVTAPASGVARVELPADGLRLGLLGKAGLLAQNAHVKETSPTLRGKFVRERVLCQSIPAPPNDVVTVIPEPNPNAPTMRERLAAHREVGQLRRLPLADGSDRPRVRELRRARRVPRDRRRPRARHQRRHRRAAVRRIRASSQGCCASMPGVSECLVRQLYRYAVAHVETQGENPVIVGLAQEFDSAGRRFPELLRAVVRSDGFRYAVKEAP